MFYGLQTLQTSKSAEDSLQEELTKLQTKLAEEVSSHKRDEAASSSRVAELEGQVSEWREKEEQLRQEREKERESLQTEMKKISKELTDSKVGNSRRSMYLKDS